jgi:TonB family protein
MSSRNRLLLFCLVLSLSLHSLLFLPQKEREGGKRPYDVDVVFERAPIKTEETGKDKGRIPREERLASGAKGESRAQMAPPVASGPEERFGPPKADPLLAGEYDGKEVDPVPIPAPTQVGNDRDVAVAALERPLEGKGNEAGPTQPAQTTRYGGPERSSDEAIRTKRLNESSGPSIKELVRPRYPSSARMLGKEGLVLLRVLIDESGRVRDVEVIKPAGHGFDEEAKRAIRSSLFNPAMEDGVPVPCYVEIPVRFVLRDAR